MASIWATARRTLHPSPTQGGHRIPFEHDYDRLLFSTPVRRMADKTQVFPLDSNDAVRTRLTHSHEVSNLARSMGVRLIAEKFHFEGVADERTIPSILATIGLAHDLGNPPFGHQGEAAIGHWFTTQGASIFTVDPQKPSSQTDVPSHLWPEFLEFEGNAQTLRIVSRLQVAAGGFGLDFTAATLAALNKYPTTCDVRNKESASTKKYGYFESETDVVEWVREKTGILAGNRHPLTWLMEAADDIAYSVLDIEDAIRKGIVSPDDVLAMLNHKLDGGYEDVKRFLEKKFLETRNSDFSISEMREIMSSYLRTACIQKLIDQAVEDFKSGKDDIFSGDRREPLMAESALLKNLKEIAQRHVFVVADVRKIEADGFRIIGGLMDFYWHAISNRKNLDDLNSRRRDAKSAFGISKISDNYLQCAARGGWTARCGTELPIRYRELRLLTDMVSGMTDGFAKSEYEFLAANGFLSNG